MPAKLTQNISSAYIEAMNRLDKRKRNRIVAFVESYDDVSFWSALLRPLETSDTYFEVMLPTRNNLGRGKKEAMGSVFGNNQLGQHLIACVDADYDFVLQGATSGSRAMLDNPFVFHTYVYAIENYECYAPALHNVCVMATLNDRRIFDFEAHIKQISQIIWPLFCWNVWAYRKSMHKQFSLTDFAHIIEMPHPDTVHPERTLEHLRHKVNQKTAWLQRQFPEAKKSFKKLQEELRGLGISPDTAYLFIRGHDLSDGIIVPLLEAICERLKREKETEIRNLAVHETHRRNELSAYQHAVSPVSLMLKRQSFYAECSFYKAVQASLRNFVEGFAPQEAEKQ